MLIFPQLSKLKKRLPQLLWLTSLLLTYSVLYSQYLKSRDEQIQWMF